MFNKIMFVGSWSAAAYDRKQFQAWEEGTITTAEAIKRICWNNQSPRLSEEDFIRQANSLGHNRDRAEPKEEGGEGID